MGMAFPGTAILLFSVPGPQGELVFVGIHVPGQIIQKYLSIMAENNEALLDIGCHSNWLPVANIVKLSSGSQR